MSKCWLRFMPIWFEFGLWDFLTIVMNELTYWQTDSCSEDLVVVSLVWHLVVMWNMPATWWCHQYYGGNFTTPIKCRRLRFWSWSTAEILKLKCGRDFEGILWSRFLKLTCGWDFEAEVCSRVWSWGVVQIFVFKTTQVHLDSSSPTLGFWTWPLCHQCHLPEVHFWLLDWKREKEVPLKFI